MVVSLFFLDYLKENLNYVFFILWILSLEVVVTDERLNILVVLVLAQYQLYNTVVPQMLPVEKAFYIPTLFSITLPARARQSLSSWLSIKCLTVILRITLCSEGRQLPQWILHNYHVTLLLRLPPLMILLNLDVLLTVLSPCRIWYSLLLRILTLATLPLRLLS